MLMGFNGGFIYRVVAQLPEFNYPKSDGKLHPSEGQFSFLCRNNPSNARSVGQFLWQTKLELMVRTSVSHISWLKSEWTLHFATSFIYVRPPFLLNLWGLTAKIHRPGSRPHGVARARELVRLLEDAQNRWQGAFAEAHVAVPRAVPGHVAQGPHTSVRAWVVLQLEKLRV